MRYFVAVAEEKHFGRAAQRLHMAQPPLSQQIKALEEELDTRLLVRTTRKVELTAAGELLLGRARLLLAEIEKLEQDVKLVGQGASGVLRVGVSGTATYRLMPTIVQAARVHMPGLRLSVQGEMLTPEMEIALEEQRVDVAVLRPPIRSNQLSLKFLEKDELVVALPEDHELASRGLLDLSELAEEPFIAYPLTSAVNAISIEACRNAGFSPQIVQETRETSTLLSFVAAGMGVALVPTARRMFALQGIVFRQLRNAPSVDLAVAWKTGNETALLNKFLDLFEAPAPTEGNQA
ncbi:LysR substrate-binding domain-containing protein [Paeniglutamicibacter sp. NPDC091659]|uniref:LysR substrate-binding domain-containing protein n=1 Tax=Paeniglutamicibacter sp. NPDC091659 TaxID=3364389 RepID=UPI00381ACDA5